MGAGALDRRVQFERAQVVDNGLTRVEKFAAFGPVIWAEKVEVSDAERIKASQVQATITARFKVRYGAFTSGLTSRDRLVCEGRTYELFGLKEVGRREWLEFTAGAVVS